MAATDAPTAQQVSNKDALVTDIEDTINPTIVPSATKPKLGIFDVFPQ